MKLRHITFNNPISIYFKIAFLANHFRDPTNRKLESEYGLTRPEFTILFCLGQMEKISAVDVADITQVPANTLSRGAAILFRKKLITKSEDPADRRRTLLSLTKKGVRLYKLVLTHLKAADAKMIEPLSDRERQQLDRLLTKMCAAVNGDHAVR